MQEPIMADQVLKCANCDVALKGPANPNPNDRVECPRCGTGDSLENALADAGEYAAEQISDTFGRELESALRHSKTMKLTKTHGPRKAHRFIIGPEA
jgi:hypothetical protein